MFAFDFLLLVILGDEERGQSVKCILEPSYSLLFSLCFHFVA